MKSKSKRKWSNSMCMYVVKDLDWIKEQILKNYDSDYTREMFIHIDNSNYGKLGYIFFSMNGSPPKGCAVYQPDHRFIIIIDALGKSKKYQNTIIEGDLLIKKWKKEK